MLSWFKRKPSRIDILEDRVTKEGARLDKYVGMVTKVLSAQSEVNENSHKTQVLIHELSAKFIDFNRHVAERLDALEGVKEGSDIYIKLIAELDEKVTDTKEHLGRLFTKVTEFEERDRSAVEDLTRMIRKDIQELGLTSEQFQDKFESIIDRLDRQAKMIREQKTRNDNIGGSFQYLEAEIGKLKRSATKSKSTGGKRS